MHQFVIPYIMHKDSKEAADYYCGVLGGHVRYIMYGKDMPNCPEGQEERVMHLEYAVNHTLFYMGDTEIEDHGRIQLHLNYDDKDNMQRSFNNMKQESTVLQELRTEFWGAIFGTLKDKYGVTWQFHYRPKKA